MQSKFRNKVIGRLMISGSLSVLILSGCSMGEEIRRIEQVKREQQASEASRSTNLTGEQVFIRSCNTCHPSGRQGMGPGLENIDTHFPTDDALKQMIRAGKGMMPPQPKTTINDQEMDSLVVYLRTLNADLKEDQKKK
jgi:mono/diheme cytochrome c family protein